jgi:DNA-binding transcriptional ArsR family regulator
MKKCYGPNLKKMPASSIFYALSDPIRMKILLTLLEVKELSCGQCETGLSKSTMSHHFKVLREVGLIQRREDGKVHYISLRQKEVEQRMPGLFKLLHSMKRPL